MQDNSEIVLVGYSGHGYVVYDTALLTNNCITAYCDIVPVKLNPFNLAYLGSEKGEEFDWEKARLFALGLGDNTIRVKIGDFILSKGKKLVTIIHPKSIVSNISTIGMGTFINAGAVINAFAKVGDMCIVNSGAIVEHECILEKGVHIGPGAVLAGNVSVGMKTFIGANTVIRQGIRIGENCTIGAGSVVVKDVPNNSFIYGNPAK